MLEAGRRAGFGPDHPARPANKHACAVMIQLSAKHNQQNHHGLERACFLCSSRLLWSPSSPLPTGQMFHANSYASGELRGQSHWHNMSPPRGAGLLAETPKSTGQGDWMDSTGVCAVVKHETFVSFEEFG